MSTKIEVMLTVVRGTGNPACYRVTREEHCGVDEAMERTQRVLRKTRDIVEGRQELILEEQVVLTRTVERGTSMDGKYIIVRLGELGNGQPGHQVFERERDFNHEYYVPCDLVDSGPVTLGEARGQLVELMRGDVEDLG